MKTLQSRIALWYGILLGVSLVAYSLAVGFTFTRHLSEEIDRRVHEDIELAARALVIDGEGLPTWAGGYLGKAIAEEEGGGHVIEVFDGEGEARLVAHTMPYPQLARPVGPEPPHSIAGPLGPLRTMTEVVSIGSAAFFVRASLSEAGVRRQIRELWLELGVISFVVLALGGWGGMALVRRAFKPLSQMAEDAQRITADDLHARLQPDLRAGAELQQLGDAFNATLQRLESSFDQLRRFTADVSHELRTPLTGLRTVGEVALGRGGSVDDHREAIETMLEATDRLSRLTDELLALARLDASQPGAGFESVDLAALVAEVVDQASVLAEERRQSLVLDAPESVMIFGDPRALRRAVLNIIDNAIKYSPEGTRVDVRVTASGESAVVEVRDQGPGIPPEYHERVFERFFRVDKSRSRELGGTGLGLSLVRRIVLSHSGTVGLSSGGGEGSTFRLSLPLAARGLSPARAPS